MWIAQQLLRVSERFFADILFADILDVHQENPTKKYAKGAGRLHAVICWTGSI